MSKKQEYIAKVGYQNELPPPLLPPKLLKYKFAPEEAVESPQLVTSLYTKTNVTPLVKLNEDLSMPLDLTKIPGVLNRMDTKYLYGFDNIKLQPEDRVLLRDPRVDRLTKTDMSKVTFLRRTEYVSTTTTSKHNIKKRSASELANEEDELLTPVQIVKRVENTFDSISDDLSKISHPTKKKVHAVKTWDLLPDTVAMDQTFFTIRMIGSAALESAEKNKLALSTALFRPVELEEDEWVTLYTTDQDSSKAFERNFEQQIDDVPEDDDRVYKFRRLRDFDMKHVQPSSGGLFSELTLRFNDERGVVYYTPLRSRIELRRRRVNDVIKPLVRENNLDQINIKLRNPTTQETKLRDRIRMKFDPIDFPAIEDDEEETKNNQELTNTDDLELNVDDQHHDEKEDGNRDNQLGHEPEEKTQNSLSNEAEPDIKAEAEGHAAQDTTET